MRLIHQLPDDAAQPLLAEMASTGDPSSLKPKGDLKHPQAYVLPTGGLPVAAEQLADLRHRIVAAAGEHGFPSTRPGVFRDFETEVAKILSTWEPLWFDGGVPSGEALRRACWTYLTVIVLPDVAIWRWPHPDAPDVHGAWRGRMLGGTRNTFQRIFRRVMSLDRGPSHPDRWGLIRDLLEDDFSSILERPTLGSNPHVAVCIAEEYLAMRQRLQGLRAGIHTRIHRTAIKDLCAYGVVLPLDLLPRADLEDLVREQFLRHEAVHISSSDPSPEPDASPLQAVPGDDPALPEPPSPSVDIVPAEVAGEPSGTGSRARQLLRRLTGG
ncbi:MAG: hypothetical protein ERJ68_00435 [Aphanocapsa feldmannii 277cI]|uniref:Uncharacterized protein n=1 Tax=Aphanocapsa feldmannii 277cI TaxID=2507554 RepID=A0A524RVU1_9CHRO|nr:MAG: hypothetical protein ERJ68_00435 [Aphanocapsa feldmannii 277cI]